MGFVITCEGKLLNQVYADMVRDNDSFPLSTMSLMYFHQQIRSIEEVQMFLFVRRKEAILKLLQVLNL